MVVMVLVVVVITLSVPMVVKCTRLDSFVREGERVKTVTQAARVIAIHCTHSLRRW